MVEASDEEFSELVEEEIIYEEGGEFNYRYFETGDGGGGTDADGLLVFDFFISEPSSGYFIKGDDRSFEEPFPADKSDSRIKVIGSRYGPRRGGPEPDRGKRREHPEARPRRFRRQRERGAPHRGER